MKKFMKKCPKGIEDKFYGVSVPGAWLTKALEECRAAAIQEERERILNGINAVKFTIGFLGTDGFRQILSIIRGEK